MRRILGAFILRGWMPQPALPAPNYEALMREEIRRDNQRRLLDVRRLLR